MKNAEVASHREMVCSRTCSGEGASCSFPAPPPRTAHRPGREACHAPMSACGRSGRPVAACIEHSMGSMQPWRQLGLHRRQRFCGSSAKDSSAVSSTAGDAAAAAAGKAPAAAGYSLKETTVSARVHGRREDCFRCCEQAAAPFGTGWHSFSEWGPATQRAFRFVQPGPVVGL